MSGGLALAGTGWSVTGNAGASANLAGGTANQIPVQTAPSTTSFITAPSTSGTFLEWNGSAFVWAAAATPATTPFVIGCGVGASVSTGTAETQLAAIVVPANTMGATGKLRITTAWSYTNSANNKSMRIHLGGTASPFTGTTYYVATSTTTASLSDQRLIWNTTTGTQKGMASSTSVYGSSSSALITSSVDTTASFTIYFTGQPASSGETITLESYIVELIIGV